MFSNRWLVVPPIQVHFTVVPSFPPMDFFKKGRTNAGSISSAFLKYSLKGIPASSQKLWYWRLDCLMIFLHNPFH